MLQHAAVKRVKVPKLRKSAAQSQGALQPAVRGPAKYN
jgi:hypothetical protein